MGDFHSDCQVRRTRREHECRQCGSAIAVGSAAVRSAGAWGGDFYHYHCHAACAVAGDDYAKRTGNWGDEYNFWRDYGLNRHELEWLRRHHPEAYRHYTGKDAMTLEERLDWQEKMLDFVSP